MGWSMEVSFWLSSVHEVVKGESFVEVYRGTIENKWKLVSQRHTCWHTISTFEVGTDRPLHHAISLWVIRIVQFWKYRMLQAPVTKLYSQNFSLDLSIISGWPKVAKILTSSRRNSISFLIRHVAMGYLVKRVLSNQQILIAIGRNWNSGSPDACLFHVFYMAGKRCSIDSVVELLKHSIVALFKFCDCFSQYEMMILSTCELVRQRSEEAVAVT